MSVAAFPAAATNRTPAAPASSIASRSVCDAPPPPQEALMIVGVDRRGIIRLARTESEMVPVPSEPRELTAASETAS